MPPLVGWAAATGGLTAEALYPFAIVFLWTPPHFWALALLISDDYERTGVPMLPVVKGSSATRLQILSTRSHLIAFTILPVRDRDARQLSTSPSACCSGPASSRLAAGLWRRPSREAALRLYLSSLAYLALLFAAMAIDRLIAI